MACCPKGKTSVSTCIKYTVLFGALLHMLCALGLISIGAWAFEEKNKFSYTPIEDVYDVIFNIAIVMIIVGSVMFIITTCGFVGALRENTCLLRFFYISLLVIFILELTGGIVVFIFKDTVLDIFSDVLTEVYVVNYQDDTEGIMDHFQENYECCGVNNYQDWNKNVYYNCSTNNVSPIKCSVPYSCCKNPDEFSPGLINILCGADTLAQGGDISKIYTKGCVETMIDLAEDNFPLVGGVIIAIAIPQLMGIFLGRRLADQIEYQWSKYRRGMARGQHPQGRSRY